MNRLTRDKILNFFSAETLKTLGEARILDVPELQRLALIGKAAEPLIERLINLDCTCAFKKDGVHNTACLLPTIHKELEQFRKDAF